MLVIIVSTPLGQFKAERLYLLLLLLLVVVVVVVVVVIGIIAKIEANLRQMLSVQSQAVTISEFL